MVCIRGRTPLTLRVIDSYAPPKRYNPSNRRYYPFWALCDTGDFDRSLEGQGFALILSPCFRALAIHVGRRSPSVILGRAIALPLHLALPRKNACFRALITKMTPTKVKICVWCVSVSGVCAWVLGEWCGVSRVVCGLSCRGLAFCRLTNFKTRIARIEVSDIMSWSIDPLDDHSRYVSPLPAYPIASAVY